MFEIGSVCAIRKKKKEKKEYANRWPMSVTLFPLNIRKER